MHVGKKKMRLCSSVLFFFFFFSLAFPVLWRNFFCLFDAGARHVTATGPRDTSHQEGARDGASVTTSDMDPEGGSHRSRSPGEKVHWVWAGLLYVYVYIYYFLLGSLTGEGKMTGEGDSRGDGSGR
ncbi:hypothetical protein F5Y11DRAFT_218461 [Daldinia sp. FL1419]|nr:hypothetical protein F5Y11DRAFT_218461 [Daldinia sp. FL1419]